MGKKKSPPHLEQGRIIDEGKTYRLNPDCIGCTSFLLLMSVCVLYIPFAVEGDARDGYTVEGVFFLQAFNADVLEV